MNRPIGFAGIQSCSDELTARSLYKRLAARAERPVELVKSATGQALVRTDGDCWGDKMGDEVVAQTDSAKRIAEQKFRVLVHNIRQALQADGPADTPAQEQA